MFSPNLKTSHQSTTSTNPYHAYAGAGAQAQAQAQAASGRHRADEIQLSKSFDPMDLLAYHRSSKDTSTIKYHGYLLKRSNKPYHNTSFNHDAQHSERSASLHDNSELVLPKFSDEPPAESSNNIIRPISTTWSNERGDPPVTSTSLSPPHMKTSGNGHPHDNHDIIEESRQNRYEATEFVASFFGEVIPPQLPAKTMNTPTSSIASSNSHSPSYHPDVFRDRISSSPSKPIAIGSSQNQMNAFRHPQQLQIPQHYQQDCNIPQTTFTNRTYAVQQPKRFSDDEAPPDEIDANDGHIWRSKYCILEGGVLFFYKNAHDGNSKEACHERERLSLFYQNETRSSQHTNTSMAHVRDGEELGKSPMPRNPFLMQYNSNNAMTKGDINRKSDEPIKASSGTYSEPILCEKYVALNKVGSVRSSKRDYGEKSFELISLKSKDISTSCHGLPNASLDDTADKLILRAESVDAMNNWIFEIHRSLKSIMKQFINNLVQCQSTGNSPVNQSHIPGVNITQNNLIAPRTPHYQNLSFSPKAAGGLALSHGHGRSGLFRRHCQSPSSTPGDLLSSMAFGQEDEESVNGMKYSLSSSQLVGQSGIVDTCTQSATQPQHQSEPNIDVSPEAILKVSALTKLIDDDDGIDIPKKIATPGKYIPPAMRGKTYVPPAMRSKAESIPMKSEDSMRSKQSMADDVLEQLKAEQEEFDDDNEILSLAYDDESKYGFSTSVHSVVFDAEFESDTEDDNPTRLGGCADPEFTSCSICDEVNIPLHASNVGKVSSKPYGYSGISRAFSVSMSWEVGAISECGVRESNEDAYLILNDLLHMFPPDEKSEYFFKDTGLFAIFDGHCKNHTARFAAEKLPIYLNEESTQVDPKLKSKDTILQIFHKTIARLDREFCELSTTGGRDWESGCTAIIALVMGDTLVVANLGDSNGALCCRIPHRTDQTAQDWSTLQRLSEDILSDAQSFGEDGSPIFDIIWKEVAVPHSPSRQDEKKRIEAANGWISTDTEIPFAQLQRMNFEDQDVVGILKRCFSGRFNQDKKDNASREGRADSSRVLYISRVCGDLAVSRSLGDRLFKAAYNMKSETTDPYDTEEDDISTVEWESPLLFSPDPNHTGKYRGDLVSSIPEISFFQIGEHGDDEFLLLACDGLWDVMDTDEAVRVTRSLLFEQKLSAKDCAKRLAELAYFLGSSDNITVIVIRFQ